MRRSTDRAAILARAPPAVGLQPEAMLIRQERNRIRPTWPSLVARQTPWHAQDANPATPSFATTTITMFGSPGTFVGAVRGIGRQEAPFVMSRLERVEGRTSLLALVRQPPPVTTALAPRASEVPPVLDYPVSQERMLRLRLGITPFMLNRTWHKEPARPRACFNPIQMCTTRRTVKRPRWRRRGARATVQVQKMEPIYPWARRRTTVWAPTLLPWGDRGRLELAPPINPQGRLGQIW